MNDRDSDPIEDRIRTYLKSRSDEPVPLDLLATAMRRKDNEWRPWWRVSRSIVAAASAAAIVFAVVLIASTLPRAPASTFGPGGSVSGRPDGSLPSAIDSPGASDAPDEFPSTVAGMPVVSVTEAKALLGERQLYGRAVAVGGWYHLPLAVPCPAPIEYTSVLEAFCHFEILSTIDFDRRVCAKVPPCQAIGANPPGVAFLEPFFMPDSAGAEAARNGPFDESDPTSDAIPVVFIGHADDPRLWHCAPESRVECARAFVIDRVAWVAGEDVDLEPHDIQMAAGIPGELLSVIEVPAGEVSALDPRLHGVGEALVTVVRSIGADAQPNGGPTRAVDVTEIADDEILASFPLEMDPGYRPARLDVQASERRDPSEQDGATPSYRVERLDGSGVWEDPLGGVSNNKGRRVYGPDMPVILEPGPYVLRAWRTPEDECSYEIDLGALDVVLYEATFPRDGSPCTWDIGVPINRF